MHSGLAWLIPLAIAGAGAGALAAVATVVRRDISELQKAMRPLRIPTRGRRSLPPEG